MRIVVLPEVRVYLKELSQVLYEKEYFGFEESALAYVDSLLDDVQDMHLKTAKAAPPHFERYGKEMQYATFRKSKATQWYIFFTRHNVDGEIVFLVRHISNNHVAGQFL